MESARRHGKASRNNEISSNPNQSTKRQVGDEGEDSNAHFAVPVEGVGEVDGPLVEHGGGDEYQPSCHDHCRRGNYRPK